MLVRGLRAWAVPLVAVLALAPLAARADDPPADAAPPAAPAALTDGGAADQGVRYFLERVRVTGNRSTAASVIRHFVPLARGDVLDVGDPEIEAIRWHLLGTGWFDDVQLRLEKASRRGWVVLVVEVKERNTLVIQQLAFGVSQGVDSTKDMSSDLQPYFGATVAETNLLGLGKTLAVSGLLSERQTGLRLRYTDPVIFGSDFLGSGLVFVQHGREFFGNAPRVSITCPPALATEEECPEEVRTKSAVVLYDRYGVSLGTGHDLGASTRYTLDWQGEIVDVGAMPDAASELRGDRVVPIDFAVERGESVVSTLKLGLIYDRRDDPALPTSGFLARFLGDFSSSLLGSDYGFVRLQAQGRSWHRLPGYTHYLRFGLFGGIVSGRAPFFYRFYASDLSDLIPSRVLEMSVDNRPPPNLLDTAVGYYRVGDVAGRLDLEYGARIFRGGGFFRQIHAFAGGGVYGLAPTDALEAEASGYEGASRFPIDLTFDLGLRADTEVGVFEFGFSSILGFFVL